MEIVWLRHCPMESINTCHKNKTKERGNFGLFFYMITTRWRVCNSSSCPRTAAARSELISGSFNLDHIRVVWKVRRVCRFQRGFFFPFLEPPTAAAADDTSVESMWDCWERVWGQPVVLIWALCLKTGSYWQGKASVLLAPPPASSQPLWGSCCEHQGRRAGSCCLYTGGQSIHLSVVLHKHLSGQSLLWRRLDFLVVCRRPRPFLNTNFPFFQQNVVRLSGIR